MTWERLVLFVHLSSVNLVLSGTIHNLRLIAEIESFEIKKAEPFLTLPMVILFINIKFQVVLVKDMLHL